jgi:integral membrane protein
MELTSVIGRMRLIALVEGISYLLFGITMPLKYGLGITGPNYVVGMVHGVLFLLYGIIALQNIYVHRWGIKTSFYVLAASLVPFGTFVLDIKVLKPVYIRNS